MDIEVIGKLISPISSMIRGWFTRKGSSVKMEAKNISNSSVYQAANDIHIHKIDEEALKRLLKDTLNEQNKKEEKVTDVESESTYKNLEKLKVLMKSGKSFTINELAIQLGLSRQTVYRYVSKLLNEGVLVQTGSHRVYTRFKQREDEI